MSNRTMPKPATGLYLRTGSTVFQWRIRVPKDLADLHPGKTWAHRVSLGTSNRAEAHRLATTLYAQWLTKFDQQRQQQSAQPVQALTPELIKELSKTLYHNLLAGDLLRRTTGEWTKNGGRLYGMPDWLRTEIAEDNVEEYVLVTDAVKTGSLEYAFDALLSAAEKKGMLVTKDTPGIEEALTSILTALQEAAWSRIERDKGYQVPTPPASKEPVKAYKLRDVFEMWKSTDGLRFSPDTVRAREIALELFEGFTGNPPIAQVTRMLGMEFKAWLQKRGKSSKTTSERMTYVKALFRYAHIEMQCLREHPWSGIKIPYETEKKRIPWTPEQISAFFSHPLYTAYALPQRQKGAGADAGYWIPLLGLFHGARSAELCQLHVADIFQVEGIWVMDINEDDEGKTVKTKSSIRQTPIHSELIRLGFLDYLDATRKAGHQRLWPALSLRAGKPSHAFSHWFNTKQRKANSSIAIPDFHSFRHTACSALSAANVAPPNQDRIVGHAVKGSIGTRVYTHVPLRRLKEEVDAIRYEGFHLPRSYPL